MIGHARATGPVQDEQVTIETEFIYSQSEEAQRNYKEVKAFEDKRKAQNLITNLLVVDHFTSQRISAYLSEDQTKHIIDSLQSNLKKAECRRNPAAPGCQAESFY